MHLDREGGDAALRGDRGRGDRRRGAVRGRETVEGDAVPVAIGAVPDTEWPVHSGLPLDDGVVCDQHCRAARGVHAVGDVARRRNPLFDVSVRIEYRTNVAERPWRRPATSSNPTARNRSRRCPACGPTSTTSWPEAYG
ncbi:FAD-dependent oxidoreductase [Streptomyces sp. NPDC005538]|uniref:FAD-dependent oxidoreductase n=1 Tax=Streptomyces sp. NPDC005538 TaxID=3157043 RepID=UPI00339F9B77